MLNGIMVFNDELGRLWKEPFIVYIKHKHEGNHEKYPG
jgi:hypothetical protein